MPILHLQYPVGAVRPGDNQPLAPTPMALVRGGPKIQVTVGPSDQVIAQLVSSGQPVPPSMSGYALIDTGATATCIDDATAMSLGLPIVDVRPMASASHAQHMANVYPAKMSLVGFPMHFNLPLATGAALQAHGLIGLIGRDILSQCQLVYTGTTGQITLSI